METLTERLSYLIALKGLKGVDLAEATSVNTSTISRILKGTQIPTAETLYKFAKFFNVTMEYLLSGESSVSGCCVSANYTLEEIKLIEFYRLMNFEDREDILLIAEMKANKEKRKVDVKSSHSESNNTTSEIA